MKYYQEFCNEHYKQELTRETYEALMSEYAKCTIDGTIISNLTIDENDCDFTIRGTDGFIYTYYTVDTPRRHKKCLGIACHENGEYKIFEKLYAMYEK